MNQRSAPLSHYFVSKRKFFRLTVLIAFAIVAILPLFVVSSASLSQKSRSESAERTNKLSVNPSTNAVTRAPSSTTVAPLFAWFQGPAPEAIATFAADCTTPQTSFAVGDVACAKASGTLIGSYKVYWVDSQGAARQTDIVSSTNPTASWTIPESGNWKAYLSTDGLRASAPFQSSDANAPAVDLAVNNSAVISSSSFVSDGIVHYQVWVLNNGPDDATDVSLVQPIPNNTARQPSSQDSGPAFDCTDNPTDTTCTLASLASGASAYFTFLYQVNNGVPVGSLITSSSTISSTTIEIHAPDNTSTSENEVISGVAGNTCTLDCPGNITTLANATQGGNPGAFVTFSTAEGVGSCGEITASKVSGSFFPVGTTTVVVTSETGGGGCSFDVIVVEAGAPTISCPADVTVTAASGEDFANVTPGTPTTNPNTGVSISGVRSDSEELTAPYPVGTTLITWTVTDGVGLTATCTQRVVVNPFGCGNDTEPPTITAPPDIVLDTPPNISGSCGFVVGESQLGTAMAADNCTFNVTRTGVPAGNFFPAGVTTITYTVTDAAGNTATDTQTVTVRDLTAPIIEAPADASYTCMSEVPAASPSQATHGTVLDENGNPLPPGPPVDNCGTPAVTVTETTTGAGNPASPRIITRTFTATDSSGNSASDVQVITVSDPTPPTISCPSDITVFLPLNSTATSTTVNFNVTGSDNCGTPTITTNAPAGNVFPVGTTTVMATANDGNGNTASCNFNVTVLYNFSGFFSPVDNLPVFNQMKAGQAVPTKFSLSGNKGLNIFAANSPNSVQIACDSGAPISEVEETSTAGSSSLTYDASSDRYHYVWKTESSWKNTCRQLNVVLNDGTTHSALFKFK
jgi:uncharacterized repeat protein (TIGR01451 family)